MMPLIARFIFAALFTASTLFAQPLSFGEAFPLTNTEYHAVAAVPRLVSNGTEVLLFWPTDTNLRVAKLVPGERRGGKSALDAYATDFSVAWNGTHFFLAAVTSNGIEGRLLTRTGEPAGEPFRIHAGQNPRLAWNGDAFLLVFEFGTDLYKLQLDRSGQPLGAATRLMTPPPNTGLRSHDVASNGDGFAVIASVGLEVSVFLLDRDGAVQTDRSLYFAPTTEQWAYSPAIASNGVNYLAVWHTGDGRAFAAPVSPGGIVGATLPIDPTVTVAGPFSLVWNDNSWLIAYSVDDGSARRVRVAHVDALAGRVVRYEGVAGSHPSLALANTSVRVAWRPDLLGAPVVATTLPFGPEPQPSAHAATAQLLGATATSNDATLIAWNEMVDGKPLIRIGLRARDGGWTEREVSGTSANARIVSAASDGREFVLILAGDGETRAVLLDSRGRVKLHVPLPIAAVDAEWDGTHYLLLGSGSHGEVSALKLSATGTSSAPVAIEQTTATSAQPVGIATNGTTTIAAWIEHEECHILCIPQGYLRIVRIDSNLQRLDTASLISSPLLSSAAIVWDGMRFLAALDNLQVIRVPLAGEAPQIVATLTGRGAVRLDLQRVAGGAALAWTEAQPSSGATNHAAFVRHDNSSNSVAFVPAIAYQHSSARVAALPDGSILYIDSRPQYAAPHHGSLRLMARISSLVPTQRPDAPSLDVSRQNGRIRLEWTAPAQRVNGYRVEYRISDGTWHELEEWFDAEERSVNLSWTVAPGVPALFRIRAFNDAGASDYSVPAGLASTKRRSVRR